MKTKQLLTIAFLAVTLMQMPVTSYALDIKVRNASESESKSRCPGKNNQPVIPITYSQDDAETKVQLKHPEHSINCMLA